MAKIALVTDSTSDITNELRQECNAHVIPLKVCFGESEYLDTDLSSEEFYRRLVTEKELPKTSQPSPEDFRILYSRLLQDYQEIISIHLSSGLSGTLNAARIAASDLKGKIHFVDSKTISLGVGLMVQEAAKYIKEGLEGFQVAQSLSKARQNIETMFTLNTLEYLQKGGRIGKVHSLMGSILNIKPVVRVGDDGIYHTYETVRSQEKALKGIVQGFKDLAKGRKAVQLAVAHGAAYQTAQHFKEMLENAFQIPASIFTQVGPVVGVHTGPGTIGAAMQYEPIK
jgi:DegV family protein with EDD domain